jgi:hypothetical protein
MRRVGAFSSNMYAHIPTYTLPTQRTVLLDGPCLTLLIAFTFTVWRRHVSLARNYPISALSFPSSFWQACSRPLCGCRALWLLSQSAMTSHLRNKVQGARSRNLGAKMGGKSSSAPRVISVSLNLSNPAYLLVMPSWIQKHWTITSYGIVSAVLGGSTSTDGEAWAVDLPVRPSLETTRVACDTTRRSPWGRCNTQ